MNNPNIEALVSSRICHDLISPVGAISNGVELLEQLAAMTPEMQLIADSVDNAKAKLEYFRICFGQTSAGAEVSTTEIRRIAEAMLATPRIGLEWKLDAASYPRERVKLLLLALLCIETALPVGGVVTISEDFTIIANARRVECSPIWGVLSAVPFADEPTAAQVQFLLLAQSGAKFDVVCADNYLKVSF